MAEGMIERMARAALDNLREQDPGALVIEGLEPGEWIVDGRFNLSALARAALAAAREPTETMLLNGWSCSGAKKKIQTLAAWQAMIDSALAEKPDG